MILIITFLLSFFGACSKSTAEDPKLNPNYTYKEINETLNATSSKLVDLNNDGIFDFAISFEKEMLNGALISSTATLNLIDPVKGGLHFDYLAEKKTISGTTMYFAQRQELSKTIDSSIYNWLLRMDMNAFGCVLFTYTNVSLQGSTVQIDEGIHDQGDVYIAFRYYDTDIEPKGWKNGWLLLNPSKDKLLIKAICYNKLVETKIKIGEK